MTHDRRAFDVLANELGVRRGTVEQWAAHVLDALWEAGFRLIRLDDCHTLAMNDGHGIAADPTGALYHRDYIEDGIYLLVPTKEQT